jgi:tripartite ATP-independent transporter DctP family solute receptor
MGPIKGPSRRAVLAGGVAFAIGTGRARAAEFSLKLATGQSPANPVNARMQEAIQRIQGASGGRVELQLFPNNQLGSDTDQISQVRNGAIDFLIVAGSVLSTLVPSVATFNAGFAFKDYDQVWQAADGALGRQVAADIGKLGLSLVAPLGNNGFRQISSFSKPIAAPGDLQGYKIRVPVSPVFTALFGALGASPTSINFNELYTSLQTHLVDGEENALVPIETAKLYEVQNYCSMTSHIWDGFCLLANRRTLAKLPEDVQEGAREAFRQAMLAQRGDEVALDASLRGVLTQHGMRFVEPDRAAFRAALAKTAFYGDCKAKFGDGAWKALQDVTGALT